MARHMWFFPSNGVASVPKVQLRSHQVRRQPVPVTTGKRHATCSCGDTKCAEAAGVRPLERRAQRAAVETPSVGAALIVLVVPA